MNKRGIANRSYPFILVVGILLFLSSCHSLAYPEFKQISQIKLEKAGLLKSKLTADLIYYNPNNFGVELKSTDLDLYIDQVYLGHSTQELQVVVQKRADFVLPLVVELDMKNLLKNSGKLLMQDSILLRAKGYIQIGKAGVFQKIPVDYTSKQAVSIF